MNYLQLDNNYKMHSRWGDSLPNIFTRPKTFLWTTVRWKPYDRRQGRFCCRMDRLVLPRLVEMTRGKKQTRVLVVNYIRW